MKSFKLIISLLLLAVFVFKCSSAQDLADTSTIDFYDDIKHYDVSTIFMADSIVVENKEQAKRKFKRPEPLGFIGDNHQRFFIHFISATRKTDKPNEYLIKGKTKVKENICDFEGTIKIISARLYKNGEAPKYKQGYAICAVSFFENKEQQSSGFIEGKLTTRFIIDNRQVFRYDNLYTGDDFSNNECEAVWTSYKTNTEKICNWGDFRIPKSGDLDTGAAQFSPDDKYSQFGWQNYRDAYFYEKEQARQEEEKQWWK